MQAPVSPSKANLATSKSAAPEDHATTTQGASSSALGLRHRSGSMAAARRTASGRRSGRLAHRSSARTAELSAATSSGLHAALLPLHRGPTSSEDSDEVGPLHGFGSLGMSGLGYGGSGSGLLHAQSSTINLSVGQQANSDDFFDIEDDAASFFSATSHLLSNSGGQSELPRFADLPNSTETSTMDLLLVARRCDGSYTADGSSAAAGPAQASPSAADSVASSMPPVAASTASHASKGHAQQLTIGFDGGYALPGVGLQLRRNRVVCAGLLLRAYTEGWGIANACMQQYMAVAHSAIHKQQQDADVTITEDKAAALDAAGPTLELDLSGWLLEVVATGGTGACEMTLWLPHVKQVLSHRVNNCTPLRFISAHGCRP
jgi:hypothetical protein